MSMSGRLSVAGSCSTDLSRGGRSPQGSKHQHHTIEVLRKMRPMRQIEAVELMIALNNFTCAYAKALLAATRQSTWRSQKSRRRWAV